MHDEVERLKITVNTGASWSAQALTTRLVIPSHTPPRVPSLSAHLTSCSVTVNVASLPLGGWASWIVVLKCT